MRHLTRSIIFALFISLFAISQVFAVPRDTGNPQPFWPRTMI